MANPQTVQFSPSYIVNVTILPTPQNLSIPNINTAALFTLEQPSWIGSQAFKLYKNASDVATDFGSNSRSYAMAAAFFSQQPNPIGSGGYLVIVPRLVTPSDELVQDAILRTMNLVYYFGILVDQEESDDTVFENLATYVQTLQKILFYASSDTNDIDGRFTDVKDAGQTNTRCLYYSKAADANATPAFASAYAGRALSTYFAGSNTTQTMNLKQLINVTPDQTLDTTILADAQDAGVDVYPSFGGVPGCYTSGENGWFDEIYNQYWFAFALQTAGFNFLATTNSKIPQTEQGMTALKNVYREICAQAVSNGFVAPGRWTSPDTFGPNGDLSRNVLEVGYFVYSQPITEQVQADREARIAPLCQIAIKAAGAIHHSDIIVNVNL